MAAARGGIVVNADSMQVYRELRVLSARPSVDDEAAAPHRLYGHVDAATRYSVGAWLADMAPLLAEARGAGRTVIVVGGTGLYFKALTEGLATVPPIPASVREHLAVEAAGLDTAALHARLARARPGGRRRGSDRRIVPEPSARWKSSPPPAVRWRHGSAWPGRRRWSMPPSPSAWWWRRTSRSSTAASPPRAEAMVRSGAIEEARGLAALRLDAALRQ